MVRVAAAGGAGIGAVGAAGGAVIERGVQQASAWRVGVSGWCGW